ncbi:ABC transporter ATP-binding protein [Spirulina subsalsa]|uniref:ABC transporter ATP-binding protein n=1 Tax=Spirulina subsalsa TaxID=54311 RepID=UPI0002DF8BC1|nr:ABC transporter ATP-binding protein [Spirulina subsalsa]
MDVLVEDAIAENPPNEPMAAVQTWELSKVYRSGFWLNQKVPSLQNLTLRVEQGETFGLLGPNGAGKTTLLKILLGIVRRTGGRARVLGKPIGDRTVKEQIGYLPENPYFYDYLTGWEFLRFTGDLFNIPLEEQKQRIPELLDMVGLAQSTARKKELRQYSKGMLQRIGLAQALINDPDLIFLDEPMSGLDPTGRYRIREIILALKAQQKTIFFNSHILADVEQICDRVAILAQGELLCIGTLDELLGRSPHYTVSGIGGNLDILKRWVSPLEYNETGWQGQLQGNPQEFLATLKLMDAQLITMTLLQNTLESYFLDQLQQRGIDTSR